MVTLESFPDRPLDVSEADALEEHEAIDAAIPYVLDDCSCTTDEVEHLFLKIDGEYVGFDFDPEAGGWRELSRAPTWEEASTAYVERAETDG